MTGLGSGGSQGPAAAAAAAQDDGAGGDYSSAASDSSSMDGGGVPVAAVPPSFKLQQMQQAFTSSRNVGSMQQMQQAFASSRNINGSFSRRPPMRRTLSVMGEDTFSLGQPTITTKVPKHVWENLGGHFSLPHHFSGLGKDDGIRLGKKLRRLVHVPGFPLLRNWRFMKQTFVADLCAGATCAVMVIPQGMAYCLLASLPSIVGLHTTTVAPFFFWLFGTSRSVLSVGPVALASIYLPTALTALGMDPLSTEPQDQLNRVSAASSLTFWIGIIFLLMSFFRLSSLLNFLSFSVMTGFTTAAGLYVGVSQIKYILDIHPPPARYHITQFIWIATHAYEANPRTMALGFTALAFLLTVKFLKKRFPPTPERQQYRAFRVWRGVATFATLIVVVATAVAAYILDQHDKGIPTVGTIEPGLSKAAFPSWSALGLQTGVVITQAVPLTLLAMMESYSVGKKFAEENGVELDQNQDLFSLGLGNVVSSCFSTWVAAGSFGRTALNQDVGARSTASNAWMAFFIIIVLKCLTKLLESIPLAVLGAVIESAIMSLLDFGEMKRALRVAPLSGIVMVITFLATFLLTIEGGLLYGVGASLAILLYQLSSVSLNTLGLEEDEGLRFVSMEEHPKASHVPPGIAVVRPVGSIFFGNAASFRARVHMLLMEGPEGEHEKGDEHGDAAAEETVKEEEELELGVVDATGGSTSGPGLDASGSAKSRPPVIHHVLIDACAMRVLDLTALGSLVDVVDEAGERGVSVVMTNLSHALKKSLESCGLLERLGGPLVTMSTEEVYSGLLALETALDEGDEDNEGDESKDAVVGGALKAKGKAKAEQDDYVGPETFHKRLTRTWTAAASSRTLMPIPGEDV